MSCPECAAQQAVYGFCIEVGKTYMSKVPEIKSCCPVKVVVTDIDSLNVTFKYNDKTYTKGKKDFMMTSWRVYDAY